MPKIQAEGAAKMSFAHAATKRPFCMQPDIQGLTPEQLAALHVAKHEVLAALFRLYTKVPEDRADGVVVKFLKDAIALVEADNTTG